MSLEEYRRNSRALWAASVNAVSSPTDEIKSWTNLTSISQALNEFVDPTQNHAHLPTGGGQDICEIRKSFEPNCIELQVRNGGTYLVKPISLSLVRINEALGDSFLLLELDTLQPCEVYEDQTDPEDDFDPLESCRKAGQQELAEIDNEYYDRAVIDRGYLGFDEHGIEIELPSDWRLVVRWLQGKILFVSKGSYWNSLSETYDGRHNRMSAEQIREFILRGVGRS